MCPFVAAGVVIGSIYWTAVTYGALTIMQAVGAKEGLALMEQSDPLFLLIGLPTVPVMLILGRLVRWEEAVLTFLNKNIPRMPMVKRLFPSFHQVRLLINYLLNKHKILLTEPISKRYQRLRPFVRTAWPTCRTFPILSRPHGSFAAPSSSHRWPSWLGKSFSIPCDQIYSAPFT